MVYKRTAIMIKKEERQSRREASKRLVEAAPYTVAKVYGQQDQRGRHDGVEGDNLPANFTSHQGVSNRVTNVQ